MFFIASNILIFAVLERDSYKNSSLILSAISDTSVINIDTVIEALHPSDYDWDFSFY